MIERRRPRADGSFWIGYYYNAGDRKEIPLGTDLDAAKMKWAELEGRTPATVSMDTLEAAFRKYQRDIIPKKAPKTQDLNLAELEMLRAYFKGARFKDVKTKHLAAYRDGRKTKRRLRKDGTVRDPGGRPAPVAANRELALFSDIWNYAREWGYTDLANPARGLRKNEETPRDYYADDEVWEAVRRVAVDELRDALDLAYLSGQRPGDVVAMTFRQVQDDGLMVRQGKTGKLLRIDLTDEESGQRTELGQLIDRMKARQVRGIKLLCTAAGVGLSKGMLRNRFEDARARAALAAEARGDEELAARIRAFQFRDTRPKAASEIRDLTDASKLLGHSKEQITKAVYRRVGERVKPTR